MDQGKEKAVVVDSFEDRNNNASILMSMAMTFKTQLILKVCNCNTIVVWVMSKTFVCRRHNFHLCFKRLVLEGRYRVLDCHDKFPVV